MTHYFAYIRISSERQAEGVSLKEQRAAIEDFAKRNGLRIAEWFEEHQTAAKSGRPVFTSMLKRLRRGGACGLLMHKIDRSARNLRDWADVSDLIDDGVDVRFVHDNLDLGSRGGRITADIQAVIAADYIRNLREEALKGIYGRYREGLLPHGAPTGYRNHGKGKPKTVDPAQGPKVREAFELYATGDYSLVTLLAHVHAAGLLNTRGRPLNRATLASVLRNRFYVGELLYRRTGEIFKGQHEALIDRRLFDQVQRVLDGRTSLCRSRHDFLFRRLITCGLCSRSLVAERQKGHVYYRCHNQDCPTTTVREEWVDALVLERLQEIEITPELDEELRRRLEAEVYRRFERREQTVNAARASLAHLDTRLARLTTLHLDGSLDRHTFDVTKEELLARRHTLEAKATHRAEPDRFLERAIGVLELATEAPLSYQAGNPATKREILRSVCSNLRAEGREPFVELRSPFNTLANSKCVLNGAQKRT